MEKSYRLQKNKQFQYVYRRGKNTATRHLVLLYVRNRQLKVGFSVSKKVGNAVIRNQTKRRLRECIRPLLENLKPGYYVVVARNSAATATYQELKRDLHYHLRHKPHNP